MKKFFTARVAEYDEHMLNEVAGCKEAYTEMAKLVPVDCKTLLDLGCGTGLELDEIYKLHPNIEVTGIDLTQAMLDRLKAKHPNKIMNLICGSYFDENFGISLFDCAVSFQTMHHFSKEKKIDLYRKLFDSLKPGGIYIECDYMVESLHEEELYFSEYEKRQKQMGIGENEFYHFDTPCTIENQIKMFTIAGFETVKKVFRMENTTIITAKKQNLP